MTSGSILQTILPILLLLGAVLVLKGVLGGFSAPTLSVRAVPLMTPIERRTIAYIEEALPWARIHAQVSMGAIMAPKKGLNRSKAIPVRNRFSSKRIDYVVENRATGSVVMLIELDDKSHRADQDARRDKMTAAAGYWTLRLPASVTPSRHNVEEQIHSAFARRPDLLPRGVRYGHG